MAREVYEAAVTLNTEQLLSSRLPSIMGLNRQNQKELPRTGPSR